VLDGTVKRRVQPEDLKEHLQLKDWGKEMAA